MKCPLTHTSLLGRWLVSTVASPGAPDRPDADAAVCPRFDLQARTLHAQCDRRPRAGPAALDDPHPHVPRRRGTRAPRAAPHDGRQVLMSVSDKGDAVLAEDRERRDAWLARGWPSSPPPSADCCGRRPPLLERLAAALSPTFRALPNRNYRLYATGGVVSNIGTWMQRVAQDWLVLQLTPTAAPPSASPPACSSCRCCCSRRIAGVVADRFPKRKVLHRHPGAAWPSSALLLGVLGDHRRRAVWHVYVLALAARRRRRVRRAGPAVVRHRDGRPRGPAQRGRPQPRVVQPRPRRSARRSPALLIAARLGRPAPAGSSSSTRSLRRGHRRAAADARRPS